VVGLSESLRTDMVGRNIGVSVYCPGTVKSNIGEGGGPRVEQFKDTGYAAPPPTEGEPSFLDFAMDAEEAGRHVLRGIKKNELFIISHPEFRDVLRARHAKIEASISKDPIDEVRAKSVSFILSNEIYSGNA
jgi:short-subunit dehydrogenase